MTDADVNNADVNNADVISVIPNSCSADHHTENQTHQIQKLFL